MKCAIAAAMALLAPLGALSAACDGRPRATSVSAAGAREHSGPAVAVFDLSDGAPEQGSSGLLGLSGKGGAFSDVVHEFETVEQDLDKADKSDKPSSVVRGVLVRLGTTRIGLARATEIGAMLETLGARLPVYCHADEYSNGTLALVARGCKRIWVSPATSVDAIGIAAQTMYFHKLLVDTIGLDVDFLQVGKFKGAEEPFTRDGPSPEARESLESTLSGLRAGWLEGFTKSRPAAVAAVEDGPYAPLAAKEHGLVDEVGYFDEARNALFVATGAVRSEVRVGAGQGSGGGDGIADVIRTVTGDTLGTAPVAVVLATGAISLEGGGVLGDAGGGGIVERRLVRLLARLEKDDDVRAVVLRIDSPGGSALASDLLWHELMAIRAKKTLVVSVGDMAASGGYYLASTGAVVFADPTSIVGSIGVVGGKFAGGKALERLGIHSETFPAKRDDPRAGPRAAYESVIIPWDAATKVRLLETMNGIYQLFLQRVAEGRHIPVERVAASAEGRIFDGREGRTRGLVDEMGGLREAIQRARTLAGLAADARVEVAGEGSALARLLGDDDSADQTGAANAVSSVAGDWKATFGAGLFRVAPELTPFVASLWPLVTGEHALCAVPFALTVR